MKGERRHQRRLSSFWLAKTDGRWIHSLCKKILEIQRWKEKNHRFSFSGLKVEMSGRQLSLQAGAQRTVLRKYIWRSILLIKAMGIRSLSQYLMSSYSTIGTSLGSRNTAIVKINKFLWNLYSSSKDPQQTSIK